jgi:hypothetical protein
MPHLGTKKNIGSLAYQKQCTKNIHTIRGPLSHPQLPLPQEEVVAHPYARTAGLELATASRSCDQSLSRHCTSMITARHLHTTQSPILA